MGELWVVSIMVGIGCNVCSGIDAKGISGSVNGMGNGSGVG
jgi:hypothetical protein